MTLNLALHWRNVEEEGAAAGSSQAQRDCLCGMLAASSPARGSLATESAERSFNIKIG